MPTLDEVNDFVYSNLELPTTSRNGTHFHTRCPLCGDSKDNYYKKRFHVQFRSEEHTEWNCFNCSKSGGFYTLYAHVNGITDEEAFKHFNRYNKKRATKRISKGKENPKKEYEASKKEIEKPYKCFNYILNDCISIDDEPDGYIQTQFQQKLKRFVEDRKIHKKLYVAYTGYFSGRVIIPVWYGNDIIYFQGRSLHDDLDPKYLNPSVYKSNVILNRQEFKKDKHIIACEGLLDAFSVGNQGTTFLGKELTNEFINLILQYTDKTLIVVMDNDEDGCKKLHEYIKLFPKKGRVRFFIMPKELLHLKDLNDIIKIKNINTDEMYKFVVENSFGNVKAKAELMFR